MTTKHFFNDATALVLDALEGVVLANPDLALDKTQKVVFNTTHNSSTHISLISGGGAGHEPAHAAYVGHNLLTAAVSGNIFASPSVSQILSAISRVGGSAGTILIIKNYTGDVFHFHLAAEKARASLGKNVHVLVVGDDVSVGRERSGKVGRRGLAGTVLVHKVLGAMSKSAGVIFQDVVKMGEEVVQNLVTVGASLDHVHIPGQELSMSQDNSADSDQIELGMGIHNEPGCRVLSPKPGLPALVDMMLDQLLDAQDKDRAYVDFGDAKEVVLLVNNLGGVSVLELSAITKVVYRTLEERKLRISRLLSGMYMTSLNGPGFSITLLKATTEMLRYIDSPAVASGWTAPAISAASWTLPRENQIVHSASAPKESSNESKGHVSSIYSTHLPPTRLNLTTVDVTTFRKAVEAACNNLITSEPQITDADTQVGDGDCGYTLARGAQAVLTLLSTPSITPDAALTMLNLASVIEENMDGTSGAIYSIFFNALASALRMRPEAVEMKKHDWSQVAAKALETLKRATPARKGDRTLMDALEPFVHELAAGKSMRESVDSAKAGLDATKGMRPAFGRAVYVEESAWNRVADPGAEGVLCILEGLASVCSS